MEKRTVAQAKLRDGRRALVRIDHQERNGDGILGSLHPTAVQIFIMTLNGDDHECNPKLCAVREMRYLIPNLAFDVKLGAMVKLKEGSIVEVEGSEGQLPNYDYG
ncbi:hypothetical protein ACLB2K_003222 [Fragaria x ananassa]